MSGIDRERSQRRRTMHERQTVVFEQDIARSHRVTHQEWLDRPWTEKLGEQVAGLLESQL